MRPTLILAALALWACPAAAQPWQLGLHLATAHQRGGYEDATPGLYARDPSGLTFGLLRNSMGRTSLYAAQTWQTDSRRWALTAGVISGYPRAPLVPLLSASARVELGAGRALRLALLPKPPGGSAALHLAFEIDH